MRNLNIRKFALLAAASAGCAALTAPATAASIDFEGTGAPCLFSRTEPLTTLYRLQGVEFSGNPAGTQPGSILNQCGNFGVNARSGTDFLAFNNGFGIDAFGARLRFGSAVTNFSLFVGSGRDASYTARFFDSNNMLIDTLTIDVAGGVYGQLFRAGTASFVEISSTDTAYVADDLSFSGGAAIVPEPASWAMMILGFGLVGAGLRRQGKRALPALA